MRRSSNPLLASVGMALALLLTIAPGTVRAVEKTDDVTIGGIAVRVRPLMLPVINQNGVIERYNQVEVTLEINDGQHFQDAQAALPRLRDVVLAEIYKAIDAAWIVHGSIVNAGALRKRLHDVCEDVIGKGAVGRVLIAPMARQAPWP